MISHTWHIWIWIWIVYWWHAKWHSVFNQGVRMGERLVPWTHEWRELGHTVIRHFSRGDKWIREVIPVPDSLWNLKKLLLYASLLAEGIWKAKECWFLQRLFFGIRSFVSILALPFRPLYLKVYYPSSFS